MASVLFLTTACPSTSTERDTTAERPVPPEATSTSLDRRVTLEGSGVLVHEATGIRFPERAAEFVRTVSARYDREGYDLSFHYRRLWSDNRAEVTIYVYPRRYRREDRWQQSPEEHLDDVVESLYREYDDVEEVRRVNGRADLRGEPVSFASSELAHRGDASFFFRPLATGTTVVAAQSWWIKTHVTTARDRRDSAFAAVDELLRELGLPPTGLAATAR